MYNEILIHTSIKNDKIYTWFGKYDTNDKRSMDFLRVKTKAVQDRYSLPPFERILKLDAPTQEDAHKFVQYVNLATKPFYQNGLGSPMFKNTNIESVKRLYNFLWEMFTQKVHPYKLIEPIYNNYRHDEQRAGYIYIIDDIETIKVGLSSDPENRIDWLKSDKNLHPAAKLKYKMKTNNMVLAEALCHAKLYAYKVSDPKIKSRSTQCDTGWDEHFKISPEEAYEKIKEIVEKI